MDMTGMDTVSVSDISTWGIGHNACVRVSAGTTVTWSGNFTAHPLVGGISPTVDGNSPIPTTTTGNAVQLVLNDAGVVPYFCQIHVSSMRGVIYVE